MRDSLLALDDQIMSTWSIVDNIRLMEDQMESMSTEDFKTVLAGLAVLYNLRFSKLHELYEQTVTEYFNETRST